MFQSPAVLLSKSSRSVFAMILTSSIPMLLMAGCGGSTSPGSNGTGPIPGETTAVVLQLSSTANDQFIGFGITLNSISLTNKAGETTTIFNTPTPVDFMAMNGNAIPLATVTVPQDVYTSAAVTVGNPGFTYVYMGSTGSITVSTDAYGSTPTPPVVNVGAPITVMGQSMGLTLSLDAPKSGIISNYPSGTAYTINPTFDLSSFALPAGSGTAQAGQCKGMTGEISAVSANSMTVKLAGHPLIGLPSLTVALDSTTAYHGVASASGLATGMLVSVDAAPQDDGSYAATGVTALDTSATDLADGQLLRVDPSYNGYVMTTAMAQVGPDLNEIGGVGIGAPYMYGSSTEFLTPANISVPTDLPFSPVFASSTLAPGQAVALASNSIVLRNPYTQPTSVTLLPQTIDGQVMSESTSGNYTVYGVQLATYDLIVQMSSSLNDPVDTTLPNPSVVYVYVSSATPGASTVSTGGTFRFNGLLFDDSGTWRMVGLQVQSGPPL